MKIRVRVRRGYQKEAQGYIEWTEYQVVEGLTILARCDHRHQAEAFMAMRASSPPPERKPATGLSRGAQRHIQRWLDRKTQNQETQGRDRHG